MYIIYRATGDGGETGETGEDGENGDNGETTGSGAILVRTIHFTIISSKVIYVSSFFSGPNVSVILIWRLPS